MRQARNGRGILPKLQRISKEKEHIQKAAGMNIEELKLVIEQRTGVQASLLTGETAEEVIARAKAVLAFRNEYDAQRPKTPQEQFSAWLNTVQGIEEQDTAGAALADIEEAARAEAGGYPLVKDGGQIEASKTPDYRTTREKFASWLNEKAAFDPFKDAGGWKKIN